MEMRKEKKMGTSMGWEPEPVYSWYVPGVGWMNVSEERLGVLADNYLVVMDERDEL